VLFYVHDRFSGWMPGLRSRSRYRLAKCHESTDWNWWRRTNDHGYKDEDLSLLQLGLTALIATVINSDIIPFRNRGMYQAAQNVLHGFGSVCGASLGGSIADSIGWRWCFLLQVPVSVFALVVGHFVIQPPRCDHTSPNPGLRGVWQQIDLSGALLLVLGLSIQLVGLSLGGNELPWGNVWVVTSLVASVVLLALFVVVEARTSAVPVIPLSMLQGVLPVCTQFANVCVGMAAYAVG
jgi:MFS family permease